MKELSIILFLSLVVSTFAKNPYMKGHYYPTYKNNTYEYDQYPNSYNHHYNDYNRYSMNVSCSGSLLLGGALFSLWIVLLILYFIVNRKKNTFTVLINSQPNNLAGYMNV